MAGKTNSDLIREMTADLIRLDAEMDNLEEKQRDNDRTVRDELRRVIDMVQSWTARASVVEVRCDHLEKLTDRRWQIWLAFIGCVLVLGAQMVLLFFRKPN